MSRMGGKKNAFADLHMDPSQIGFKMFQNDEIKKLSVIKIGTPLTFNVLGHPLPGGLYDIALGPLSEKSDPCGTCLQNIFQCPGHFGYIELPVPVVNPLFHKIIRTLLKITCLSCFKLQITERVGKILQLQLQLVDAGYAAAAQELDMLMFEEGSTQEETDHKLNESRGLLKSDKLELVLQNKHTECQRVSFVNTVLSQIRLKLNCIHCKARFTKITAFHTKLMINVGDLDTSKSKIQSKDSNPGYDAGSIKLILPDESRRYLRELWFNESHLLQELVPVLKLSHDTERCPIDQFYLDVLLVPPPNVRPVNFVRNQLVEHPQTQVYKSILNSCSVLRAITLAMNDPSAPDTTKAVFEHTSGATPVEKWHNAWQELQSHVDHLLDREMSRTKESDLGQGLKQVIEKKQGVIRQHMMGKRVNFAARSVITPDPNLNIDEIGIPESFAKKLSYPVPVTTWNVRELRTMVMNGPDVHPGAVMVENEDGTLIRIPANDVTKQESIAKRLLTPSENSHIGVKIVHRHLCNGDILLLNRQPTLHRPSIMAHKARVLPKENTLRLHYANCKAYNADFDGDEMNAHLPQSELARSEAYNLVNVSNNYLVPKDGTPLSGLIQDHMVSGVRLSIRGRFFTREDYHMLVYQGLSCIRGELKLLPPAIIKPVALWSGKQVLSTLIINTTPAGLTPITLNGTAKISSKAWETAPPRAWRVGGTLFKNTNVMSEAEVVIQRGELLCGVLDKTHYGATPYGLIHCMYELYGGSYSSKLLSSFAKVFTSFLQIIEGFSLGVHDILLVESADRKRTKIVDASRKIGLATSAAAVNLPTDADPQEVMDSVEAAYAANPKFRAILDRKYKEALDKYTNEINKTCLPAGLLSKFPDNNLQLMVQSGAKGSTVNTMQISCLLGQIELEGKRPPVMISGKSLPSFPAYEPSPRAGGFIDGRFMTGIQPQEFFFHCMAGREGLIDTAVKTSRSGYLQRCLIKHLEGLTVKYDLTVRDSDNRVIQFLYGEDGMDISKVQFLKETQLQFLAENSDVVTNKEIIKKLESEDLPPEALKQLKDLKRWKKHFGSPLVKTRSSAFAMFSTTVATEDKKKAQSIHKKSGRNRLAKRICRMWAQQDPEEKLAFEMENNITCPDPVVSKYNPDHHYGVLCEKISDLIDNYTKTHLGMKKFEKAQFTDMMKFKAMTTLCHPGEAVGLLAAQSIGEPSTQMTLNTFHFAGRGEMNVTLGIPRLREILMMASKNIKTPSMDIPFLPNLAHLETRAERIRKSLVRVTVADVLESINVDRVLEIKPTMQHNYCVRFNFLPLKAYENEYNVNPAMILKYMENKFFNVLFSLINKVSKVHFGKVSMDSEKAKQKRTRNNDDSDAEDPAPQKNTNANFGEEYQSSEEEVENDEDATNARVRARRDEGQTYEDPEDEEIESEDSDSDGENNDKKTNIVVEDEHEDAEDEEIKSEDSHSDGEKNDQKTNIVVEDEYEDAERVYTNTVVQTHSYAKNYIIDTELNLWCQITFCLPLTYNKLDMSAVLKEAAEKCVIRETPCIKRAITYLNNSRLMLKTDGINIVEMFKYHTLLDLNKLYSNDIHGIASTYGIEAAAKVIVKEVQNVFNVYGITVDPRHLLLIADYMTCNGTFQPMSRRGMEGASPLQQMSFESSLAFLKDAVLLGKTDNIASPSSCLMVGQPCGTGTGAVSLMASLNAMFQCSY